MKEVTAFGPISVSTESMLSHEGIGVRIERLDGTQVLFNVVWVLKSVNRQVYDLWNRLYPSIKVEAMYSGQCPDGILVGYAFDRKSDAIAFTGVRDMITKPEDRGWDKNEQT